MPMREDASYCRPRLYDEDDDERPDDVGLLMDALERVRDDAMAEGDDETVWHSRDLARRIAASAGDGYEASDGGTDAARTTGG